MLGDRDLNVLITPLPRDKRAKNPHAAKPTQAPAESEEKARKKPPAAG
jgi:hypothetical protein